MVLVAALWAAQLLIPVHYLQGIRKDVLGYQFPVYYLFVFFGGLLSAVLAALALRGKNWSREDLAWWGVPLSCLPGIFLSTDRVWCVRQLASLVVRGIALGWAVSVIREQRAQRLLLNVVSISALAAAGVGLVEIVHGSNPLYQGWVWRSVSEPVRGPGPRANPFYRPQLSGAKVSFHTSPPYGTQGNNVPYSVFLVAFAPLALARLRAAAGAWKKAAHGAVFLIFLATIFSFNSRSAWLGLSVSLALYGVVSGLFRSRSIYSLFLAFCMAAFGAAAALSSSSMLQDRNIAHRLKSYSVMRAMEGRWLFGVGYGHYDKVYKEFYSGPIPELATPDNQYLRWLIENGVVGLAVLLVCLGLIAGKLWRAALRSSANAADFSAALLCGWAGMAVAFLFFDGFYWGACNATFWGMLGLSAALAARDGYV